jgi:hypothetical protein
MREPEIVWLVVERHFAVLVNRGAFTSVVKFSRDGADYEVEIENDDYEFYEDANDYECE